MSLIKLDDPIEFNRRSRPVRWILTSSEIRSGIKQGEINTFKDYLDYIQTLQKSKIWRKNQIGMVGIWVLGIILALILALLLPFQLGEPTIPEAILEVMIPNLLSLYNASRSTTDIAERFYFVFQLSGLLIGIVILFGMLLSVLYLAFFLLIRPYRLVTLTKYEMKLIKLFQDPQLPSKLNPSRTTQSLTFKFEYIHPELDFEDFYHAIKPIPLLYVSHLFFLGLGL